MPPTESADSHKERQVLEVFEGALEIAPAERLAYLDTACVDDAELRARVEEMLSLYARPSSLLESVGKLTPESLAGDAAENPVDALFLARPELARLFEEAGGGAGEDGTAAATGPPSLDGLPPLAGGKPRYARGEEIARGGMGVIYRVWDDVLRRPLAVKVSRERARRASDPDSLEGSHAVARFLEEARVTAQLDHPGVVPLHDIGLDGEGRFFFTMRLVEGLDLGAVFASARERREGWSPTRALGVLVRVCETLAYAHSKGVVHRDLKPQNVMVGRYGETYVMDWGLAKVLGGKDPRDLRIAEPLDKVPADLDAGSDGSPLLTRDGAIVGTPSFMPPEQADGRIEEIDQRSDVYAVGAMLYTLLAGHQPYASPGESRSARRILSAVRRGPPAPLRQVASGAPAELVAICDRAMARSRSDRYASMDDLGEDLRAYLENRVVRAHRTGAVVELQKWVARNRATAASLAGLFVFLILGLAVSLWLLERANTESEARGIAIVEKDSALDRADAMRLCAQSSAVLASDPGQALLMAIEAARLEPGYRADTALLAALDALRETRTLIGQTGEVTGTVFTPDGRRVVTASRDGTVRVWDPEKGDEILHLRGRIHAPNGIVIDAGGRLIASFGWGVSADVWDLKTGKLVGSLAHPHVVDAAAFTADGRRLITGARDGIARIWIIKTGKVEVSLKGHRRGLVSSCRFTAKEDLVVTASHDGTARLWDTATGAALGVLEGHTAELTSAELSPDGRLVVTASMDNTARVWDAAGGKQIAILAGHSRWLRGAVFSPDGRWILTHSGDATARLWDAATGESLAVLRGHEDGVNSAGFSSDSRRVLTASEDRTARIWDVTGGTQLAVLRGHQSAVLTAVFSRDGRRAVTGSKDNTARVWDASTEDEAIRLTRPVWDRSTVFSPDGSRVLVFGTGRVAEIRSAASGEAQATLSGHAGGILGAAFGPGCTRAATASLDRTARIWDAASGRELAALAGHDREVNAVAFNPDGSRVATASGDHTAALWDASTGKMLHRLKGYSSGVHAVDFSPDGRLLAAASDDRTVRLWDVASGQPGHQLDHGRTGWLRGALFSRDGERLLTASLMNTLFVWDVAAGKLTARLVGHDADFLGAAFAASGDRLATLHADGAAHVWDLPSGRRRTTVRSPDSRFRAASFDGGGGLWTDAVDGTRRLWTLDPLSLARARVPRRPDLYDWTRIDVGSVDERRDQRFHWVLRHLGQRVPVAERSWENNPEHRDGLFHHAQALRETICALGSDEHRVGSRIGLIEGPPGPERLADLIERGLRLMERAALLPGAHAEVHAWLAEARRACLPSLPTYGSVEAALTGIDRATLVGPDQRWRLFRGVREPSPGREWTAPGFNDGAWEEAALPAALGYPDARTQLDDMPGKYSSVYVRHRFSVPAPSRWQRLRITVRRDDGCIAFLNGVEVYRQFAGRSGEPRSFDAPSSGVVGGRPVESRTPVPARLLRAGENVLALCGLNSAIEDKDFFLAATLEGEAAPDAGKDREVAARFEGAARGAFARARRYLEGRILERRGRHADAARIFRALCDEDPTRIEVLCRLVDCLRASGGSDEADAILRASLAAEPPYPEKDKKLVGDAAWSVLREGDRALEDYYLAARWADLARNLEPPLPVNISRLTVSGIARYRLGLYREALATFEITRVGYAFANPGRSSTRDVAFLAMTCHRLGLLDRARETFLEFRDPAQFDDWTGSPHVLEAASLLGMPIVEEGH